MARPTKEDITTVLGNILKDNSEWMLRCFQRHTLFTSEDVGRADKIVAKMLESKDSRFNPTVAERMKFIKDVDRELLFKLSGHDALRGRDKDEFRSDAVLLQHCIVRSRRNKNEQLRRISTSTIDERQPLDTQLEEMQPLDTQLPDETPRTPPSADQDRSNDQLAPVGPFANRADAVQESSSSVIGDSIAEETFRSPPRADQEGSNDQLAPMGLSTTGSMPCKKAAAKLAFQLLRTPSQTWKQQWPRSKHQRPSMPWMQRMTLHPAPSAIRRSMPTCSKTNQKNIKCKQYHNEQP